MEKKKTDVKGKRLGNFKRKGVIQQKTKLVRNGIKERKQMGGGKSRKEPLDISEDGLVVKDWKEVPLQMWVGEE